MRTYSALTPSRHYKYLSTRRHLKHNIIIVRVRCVSKCAKVDTIFKYNTMQCARSFFSYRLISVAH